MGQKNSYISKPIFSEGRAPDVPRAYKALLVGVSYRGKKDAELKGSAIDVRNMQHLLESQGVKPTGGMRILLEDSNEEPPTKANILQGVEWLSEGSSPGDVLILYLVGNGGDLGKLTNNKLKHPSDVLLPSDFKDTVESAVLGNEIYQAAAISHGVKLIIIRDFSLPGSLLPLPFKHTWVSRYEAVENEKLADFIDKDILVISITSDKPQRLPTGMLTTALVTSFISLGSRQYPFTYNEILQVLSGRFRALLKGTHSTAAIFSYMKYDPSETFTWQCADTQRGLSIPVGSKVTLHKLQKELDLNGQTGVLSERYTGGVVGVSVPGRDAPVNVLSKNLLMADGSDPLSSTARNDVPIAPRAVVSSSISQVPIINDEILDTAISRDANDNSNWVVIVRKPPEAPLGLQLSQNLVLLGIDPNTPASEAGVSHSTGRTLVFINNNPVYTQEDVLRETIGSHVCTLEFSEKQATDKRSRVSVPNSTVIPPPATPSIDSGFFVASGVGVPVSSPVRNSFGRGRGRVMSGPSYEFPVAHPPPPPAARPSSPMRLAVPSQSPQQFHSQAFALPPKSAAFNEHMQSLQQQKQIAVASENYIEAKRLKAEIDRLSMEGSGGPGQRPAVPLAERVVSLERRLADTEAALAHREYELDRMRTSPPVSPNSYSGPSIVPIYPSQQQLPPPPTMVPMTRIQVCILLQIF